MASSDNHHPTADHVPVEKKAIEETEKNKQENVGKEEPKEKFSELAIPVTKSEESSDDKKTEVHVKEAAEEIVLVEKSTPEEKPAVEATENLPEEKPATEEPSKVIVEELQENAEGKVEKDEGTKAAAIESSPETNEEAQADLKEVAKGSPVSGVVKEEENVKTDEVTEATGNVKAEETKKADTNVDSTKEGEDTKTSEDDLPTKDVSAKPPQKSSWNLLSRVKQSIGKVKKAIVGKSPSSKTLQPEDKPEEKDDEKVN